MRIISITLTSCIVDAKQPIKKPPEIAWRLQCMHTRKYACQRLTLGRINIVVFSFLDEQHADHKRHQSDDDRIPQAVVDIALVSTQRKRGGRQQAAEPAVTDMVR